MLSTTRRRSRFASPIIAAFLLLATTTSPGAAAPPPDRSPAASIPVVGMVTGGGTFSGVLNITSFAVRNGEVVALGTVSGVVTNAAGAATSAMASIAAPVAITQATCEILHLDLGPIALDILGLHVDLSRVVLDIYAESGAGNLLGNLLCAVAGLLDNPGGLANLLNRILEALLG
jgi:hypothetical protein